MTSESVGVPAAAGYIILRQQLPAGITIQNMDQNNAVWISDSPNVAPGNGIRLSAFGTVTWAQDGPCYACVDSGVTSTVSVMLSDAVTSVTDPVALAAAVAIKLLNQEVTVTNPVGLAAGTAVGINGTPSVGLAPGTAVGISGTPSVGLAPGTAVGIAAGQSVGLAAGTAVGIASGQSVGISGNIAGITNAIPVQSHPVTLSGNLAGITSAIPVQSHPVTLSGNLPGITNPIPVQTHPVTFPSAQLVNPLSSVNTMLSGSVSLAASGVGNTVLNNADVSSYSELLMQIGMGTTTGVASDGGARLLVQVQWLDSSGRILLEERRFAYNRGNAHFALACKSGFVTVIVSQNSASAVTMPIDIVFTTDETYREFFVQETSTTSQFQGVTDNGSDLGGITAGFVGVILTLPASLSSGYVYMPSRSGRVLVDYSGGASHLRFYHDISGSTNIDAATQALLVPTSAHQQAEFIFPPWPTIIEVGNSATTSQPLRCTFNYEN